MTDRFLSRGPIGDVLERTWLNLPAVCVWAFKKAPLASALRITTRGSNWSLNLLGMHFLQYAQSTQPHRLQITTQTFRSVYLPAHHIQSPAATMCVVDDLHFLAPKHAGAKKKHKLGNCGAAGDTPTWTWSLSWLRRTRLQTRGTTHGGWTSTLRAQGSWRCTGRNFHGVNVGAWTSRRQHDRLQGSIL